MSEVHRYRVVTMLSAAGATIGYDPHGPDVVMAADFDRVTDERDALQTSLDAVTFNLDKTDKVVLALQQRLTAADERVDVLEAQLAESRKITLSGCEFSEHELISRAVRAASGTSRRGTQRWVAMRDAFGCGSGVANALCRRFGFDPDEMVKP